LLKFLSWETEKEDICKLAKLVGIDGLNGICLAFGLLHGFAFREKNKNVAYALFQKTYSIRATG
jgi:hypothetical protein